MYRTILRISRHIRAVQSALFSVSDELRNRGLVHDASKLEQPELKGYLRFEEMPEGLEYGSKEYTEARAAILKDNDCFERHCVVNDHHPEYWIENDGLENMPLFALIEMVCDWYGAHNEYGNKSNWADGVVKNVQKYNFTQPQQYVIFQMAEFLGRGE